MVKVAYIISDISKMIAVEWICELIDSERIQLSFVFLNQDNSEIEEFVRVRGYEFIRIKYAGKKDLPKALWKTYRFLKKNKCDAIHCHLFDATIVGLMAGVLSGVKQRVFTRHYATYHHVYFPRAVKYDLFMNRMATDIVAISQLVKTVLIDKEHVSSKKVHLIYHGFQLAEYASVEEKNIRKFRSRYNISEGDIVVGVVARYTLLKGIQFIIPAFIRLLQEYPQAKLLIANNHGNDEAYLRGMLSQVPPENVIEVTYERDMGALYKSLNMYIHVPISDHIEAFGQTYVEALMAGIPSIFTLSGIAQEFIEHEKNAIVVPFEDADAIYTAMKRLLCDPELVRRITLQGSKDASERFDVRNMVEGLEKLYLAS